MPSSKLAVHGVNGLPRYFVCFTSNLKWDKSYFNYVALQFVTLQFVVRHSARNRLENVKMLPNGKFIRFDKLYCCRTV